MRDTPEFVKNYQGDAGHRDKLDPGDCSTTVIE